MTRPLTPQEARRRAALVLAKGREVTNGDIATLTGMSVQQATAAIVDLCDMGLAERAPGTKVGIYRVRRQEAAE
jgi:DNA-binding MarR family transcriptional regulator